MSDAPNSYHLIMAVWGKKYIHFFLNYCIESLFTEGNIPSVASHSALYHLITTKDDFSTIKNHPNFRNLKKIIPVKITFVEFLKDDLGNNKYSKMIHCHKIAIQEACLSKAAIVFLPPDHIFSSDCLSSIRQRFAEGYRSFMLPGLRFSKQRFVKIS